MAEKAFVIVSEEARITNRVAEEANRDVDVFILMFV
jgi:hypothetical protein